MSTQQQPYYVGMSQRNVAQYTARISARRTAGQQTMFDAPKVGIYRAQALRLEGYAQRPQCGVSGAARLIEKAAGLRKEAEQLELAARSIARAERA